MFKVAYHGLTHPTLYVCSITNLLQLVYLF